MGKLKERNMGHQELRDLIKERFDYSEGKLIWKYDCPKGVSKGDEAGYITKKGFRNIQIGSKNYRAHRLVWLYLNNEYPSIIGHINGDATDNRIENLSKSKKRANARLFTYKGTGYPLVSGQSYDFADFAVATGISPQTIQSRFKHRKLTTTVRDCDLYPVRAKISRCKLFEYQGNHPSLVSGQSYSYVQLGAAFGINDKLIRDRMRGSRVFTDAMAIKTPGGDQFMRCETRSSKTMNEWLRRKIV
tara:strand:- start:10 stop:747 length:738 start_codon:yes stop_codon:yes gene_type:complete